MNNNHKNMAIVAISILLVATMVTCTACTTDNDKHIVNTNTKTITFSTHDTNMLNQAVQSNEGREPLSLATARPSVIQDKQGNNQVMTIYDRDESHKNAGLYTLQVFCIGKGQLDINFKIADSNKSNILKCQPDISTALLSIQTEAADLSEVIITPNDSAICQIAYRIDYN